MISAATNGIRRWIVGLFVSAIERTSRPEDRHAAILWLLKSREILAGDAGLAEKLKALNAQLNARAGASAIAAAVADAVRNYRTSSLPWPMKVAMPATLAAIPVVGMHGAGIAAFGSAIGLPVLLLVFLGTAGITSIIETVATIPNSRAGIAAITALILAAEYMRAASAAFREAMRDEAAAPKATPMPEDEAAIRSTLLAMDPFDLESHVMSFFEKAGLYAVVTPRSNDFGMDGYAAHPEGLIVVQCKRYATDNKVGRPALQQFATVIRDQGAWRGYVVTTSSFSSEATAYAGTAGIVLVDMAELVKWTRGGSVDLTALDTTGDTQRCSGRVRRSGSITSARFASDTPLQGWSIKELQHPHGEEPRSGVSNHVPCRRCRSRRATQSAVVRDAPNGAPHHEEFEAP